MADLIELMMDLVKDESLVIVCCVLLHHIVNYTTSTASSYLYYTKPCDYLLSNNFKSSTMEAGHIGRSSCDLKVCPLYRVGVLFSKYLSWRILLKLTLRLEGSFWSENLVSSQLMQCWESLSFFYTWQGLIQGEESPRIAPLPLPHTHKISLLKMDAHNWWCQY